jgi:hypothetical protein
MVGAITPTLPRALASALSVLNDRERRIFQARRLSDDPITLQELSAGNPPSARPTTRTAAPAGPPQNKTPPNSKKKG